MDKYEELQKEFEQITESYTDLSERSNKIVEIMNKVLESFDKDGVDDRFDALVERIKHESEMIKLAQSKISKRSSEWREKAEDKDKF